MFAVIKTYNNNIKILNITTTYELAEKLAYDYSVKDYGNDLYNCGNSHIKIDNILLEYTSFEKKYSNVYSVVKLPEIDKEAKYDISSEVKKMEEELLIAFLDNNLYKYMKKHYSDICSNGDIMINRLIDKYNNQTIATLDELYYIYHLYSTYIDMYKKGVEANTFWAD